MLQCSIGGFLTRSSWVAGEGLPLGRAGWVGWTRRRHHGHHRPDGGATRSAILTDTERQLAQLNTVFAGQTGRAPKNLDSLLKTAIDTVPSLPAADVNVGLARRLAGGTPTDGTDGRRRDRVLHS